MQLINLQILLIQLYLFIKVLSDNEFNLTESNSTNITNWTISCDNFTDCFNCTLIPKCRWLWENESCILFEPFDRNYSLKLLNNYTYNNDIKRLNNHINFIRKSCFLPTSPFIENKNSYIYNNISLKYCGPHYILNKKDTIKKDFKIEINNIKGIYGTPNLLCEFIILSSPSFEANIVVNEEERNNFYLLYSPDSLNFTDHINTSKSLFINTDAIYLNTFIFYGLKSFKKSPFTITYKETIIDMEKAVEATGFIMIGLSVIMIIIILGAIIYIRKKTNIFKKEKEKNIYIDEEKLKIYFKKSEEAKLREKKSAELSSRYIYNFSPQTNTPTTFLNKQAFVFENICCACLNKIENKEDIKKTNCEHCYHSNCFDKLIEDMNNLNEKEVKCINCQKIIYQI